MRIRTSVCVCVYPTLHSACNDNKDTVQTETEANGTADEKGGKESEMTRKKRRKIEMERAKVKTNNEKRNRTTTATFSR